MNSNLLSERKTPVSIRRGTRGVMAIAACLTGVGAYSAVSQIIAVGTMEHSALVGGPATVTMRPSPSPQGEVLSWHYHPGAGAFTVVTSGTLNLEGGCGSEIIYTAGQAFLEPPHRVHRGKNLTAEPVMTAQTFIVPAGEGTTVVTGQQLCGVPLDVQECKGDGWMAFDHPRSFVSQGDCVSYVLTGE